MGPLFGQILKFECCKSPFIQPNALQVSFSVFFSSSEITYFESFNLKLNSLNMVRPRKRWALFALVLHNGELDLEPHFSIPTIWIFSWLIRLCGPVWTSSLLLNLFFVFLTIFDLEYFRPFVRLQFAVLGFPAFLIRTSSLDQTLLCLIEPHSLNCWSTCWMNDFTVVFPNKLSVCVRKGICVVDLTLIACKSSLNSEIPGVSSWGERLRNLQTFSEKELLFEFLLRIGDLLALPNSNKLTI